MVFNGVKIQ